MPKCLKVDVRGCIGNFSPDVELCQGSLLLGQCLQSRDVAGNIAYAQRNRSAAANDRAFATRRRDTVKTESLWVLGHKIRPLDTDASYGMVEVISPPHVPGPPPHFHKRESEFVLVVDGTLDVMTNGDWARCGPGSFLDLRPETTHTFINNTEEPVVWLTGWRPKGFERFFRDFGVPATEARAQDRSVAEDVVQRVVQNVGRYGMYVQS